MGDMDLNPQPADFDFWYSDKVRFTDLDALGHAGSVMINSYFAGARTKLFKLAIPDWPKGNIAPVLRKSEIEYRNELFFNDEIEVGLKIQKFGNTSFTLDVVIFKGNTCMALSENVFVFIDRDQQKAVPIPEDVKSRFIELTELEESKQRKQYAKT